MARRSARRASLHAASVIDGRDRKRLERMLRYMLRPPFTHDAVRALVDGRSRTALADPGRAGLPDCGPADAGAAVRHGGPAPVAERGLAARHRRAVTAGASRYSPGRISTRRCGSRCRPALAESRRSPSARMPQGKDVHDVVCLDHAEAGVVSDALEKHAAHPFAAGYLRPDDVRTKFEPRDQGYELVVERCRCLVAVPEPPATRPLDLRGAPTGESNRANGRRLDAERPRTHARR